MLLLCLLAVSVDIDVYRFDESYVEVWYDIPVSQIFSSAELESATKNTVLKKYAYRFILYDKINGDSAFVEGEKGAQIAASQKYDYFIDYVPLYLYPGKFQYTFIIETGGFKSSFEGDIELPGDTISLTCSDIILGKRTKRQFVCHGFLFEPSISQKYESGETLFSYVEIYDLVPDSLYYDARYKIVDSVENVIFDGARKYIKHDFTQTDTLSVYLENLIDGAYTFSVEIFDPAQQKLISLKKEFRIITLFDEVADKELYHEIQYLVSPKEFKKFKKLDTHERKVYLKKFWSERDYWEFEQRLTQADARFSIRSMKGRDSERGKYYILNGPSEEIEIISMIEWAKDLELWHYYSKGKEILFCDTKDDGNPRFVAELRTGELMHILELGLRNKEDAVKWPWLFEIAPGTYFGQKSKMEEKEERLQERYDRENP